jgi:hypothetical protein
MYGTIGWLPKCRPPRFCNSDVSHANSAAIRALKETRGYVVALSSVGAQLRIPGSSDANISKHAVNRLIEFVALGEFLSRLCLYACEKW